MICEEMEGLPAQRIVGTLATGRQLEVERHLEGCDACLELARDLDGSGIDETLADKQAHDHLPVGDHPREWRDRLSPERVVERDAGQRDQPDRHDHAQRHFLASRSVIARARVDR